MGNGGNNGDSENQGNKYFCCGFNNNTEIQNKKYKQQGFFEAYKSIHFQLSSIKRNKDGLTYIYLIKTKSIPKFIGIIKESRVLEQLEANNDPINYENDFKLLLNKYEKERLSFFKDYKECENASRKEEDNEFIIVDKKFLEKFNCSNEDYNYEVGLKFLNENNYEIFFPVSKKSIKIISKENNFGFFQFKMIDQNDEDKNDINNMNSNVIENKNENNNEIESHQNKNNNGNNYINENNNGYLSINNQNQEINNDNKYLIINNENNNINDNNFICIY